MALAMIEQDYGHELAQKVAARMVVFLKRPGGQAQFSASTAQSMSDYIYATDAGQSGTATTVYVFDGVSGSLFSLPAPNGITGFSGLRTVPEMTIGRASCRERV